ncbi:MAG: type II 3-dehydroquinate dehydratase [Acidimicrobiia bacterium]|nr:type II 3-dehydroquinate dehydratase [Acidimicrobiia bacterium]
MRREPEDSTAMHLFIANGPNLNLLGTREPDIYGTDTLDDLSRTWTQRAARYGATIESFQSNHEGALVDAIHLAARTADGLVINAGAYTLTSRAIPDAITATGLPTVEVHISNIFDREPWRSVSFISPVAMRSIVGRGARGYLDAVDHLVCALTSPPATLRYGDHDDAVFDIRIPPGGHDTVVCLLHGGFWRDIWTREILDPVAVDLVDRGAATVNIEYRRGTGSYPGAVDDVAASLDRIRDHPAALGLNPEKLVVVGHSAGGYLALTAGEQRTDLERVVAIAPAADLRSFAARHGDDDPAAAFVDGAWDDAVLGRNPRVPISVIHGDADELVPIEHGRWYAEAESSVELVELSGVGHHEPVDVVTDAYRSVVDAIVR